MRNKLTMILMVGLARSGKSTYIKKNNLDAVIVSPDRIRKLIFGHQFHKESEDFVWAYAKGMARLLLEQSEDVLIDATNLNFQTREQWYNIAKEYSANIRIIWVKTSLKECKKRNARGPENERLPESVLDGMASIFTNPTESNNNFDIELIETPYKGKHGECGNIYLDEIIERRK